MNPDLDTRSQGHAHQPAPNQPDEDLFQAPTRKASPLNRWSHAVLGVVLIVVGVVLAILPVVPGFPLIAVGVLMLAAASEPSRRFLNRTEHRFPAWVRRILRKVVGHRPPDSSR